MALFMANLGELRSLSAALRPSFEGRGHLLVLEVSGDAELFEQFAPTRGLCVRDVDVGGCSVRSVQVGQADIGLLPRERGLTSTHASKERENNKHTVCDQAISKAHTTTQKCG